MSTPLIAARGVGKTYRLYRRPHDRLLELLTARTRHRPFDALDGVSFELARGESLGIIGENGAGKSTLLKILSGVTAPSRGEVRVAGTVASLLELGTGFHPEFTGRQNIRLNAAMMGLEERDVERRLPDIVAFSELGDFIDRPVKTYSTGMAMRLGFAIAVQVDPDVLIIDEALSVGDGYFQKKCMDRIRLFLDSGRTLLFCSHAMYYVATFCETALWLRRGKVAALGRSEEVIREYESFLLRKGRERPGEAVPVEGERGPAWITRVEPVDGASPRRHGAPWVLEIEWQSRDAALAFQLGVGVDRVDGVQICSFASQRDGVGPFDGARSYRVRLLVAELPMIQGEFDVYVFLLDAEGVHVYDRWVVDKALRVDSPEYRIGIVEAEHSWDVLAPAAAGRSLRAAVSQ